MGFLFRKAAGPQTNGAGESFPIWDLCSPESDVGLAAQMKGDVLLPLVRCKWSVVPPWRCPSVTVANLGLAGLADAVTRVFDFRNLSQEPLHKKPA